MTVGKIVEVMKCGDSKGSALKDLAKFYHCDDYDLSPISDKMADSWLKRQKCECYHEGSWIEGYGSCWGTKEQEPCACKGDRTKCDFYKEKQNGRK